MITTDTQHPAPSPIRPLEWQRLGAGRYRAEPLPGIVYSIYPAPDGVGVVFMMPGLDPAGAMRASIARYSCEHHWRERLGPRMRELAAF